MSSRSWLSYSYQSRFHLTPLSYETLEYASGFASEQCPEGIVAISTNTLRWVSRRRPTFLTFLEVSDHDAAPLSFGSCAFSTGV